MVKIKSESCLTLCRVTAPPWWKAMAASFNAAVPQIILYNSHCSLVQ